MIRALPVIMLLMLSSHTSAQPVTEPEDDYPDSPVAVITGPTQGRPGQIVILDASKSENATGFVWHVETDASPPNDSLPPEGRRWASVLKSNGWKEPEGEKEPLWLVSDDDKRVLLASYPGTYRITLAVGNVESDTPSLAYHTFVSSDTGQPDDDNPPDDSPPPPDDGPDDEVVYDFSDEVSGWLEFVPVEYRGKSVKALADVCVSMDDDRWISKDFIDGRFGVVAAFAVGNDPDTVAAWQPFFRSMSEAFDTIPESATLDQYKQAYVSIGKGLKGIDEHHSTR